MKLYLAGPLFTCAERMFNEKLKELLWAHNHEVWLPQEHEQELREGGAKDIFLKDVEGVDWCDVVIANMDGPDPDSGTCWECGYAYKKKPIILFRTDFRVPSEAGLSPFNLMLSESADEILELPWYGINDIADGINAAIEDLPQSMHVDGYK